MKAQIHAGGRGKAGGVKVAKNLDEVRTYAKEILGKTLSYSPNGTRRQRSEASYLLKKAAILKKNIMWVLC